jgi:succinate dehydrogenase / fumarate reductase cytochrome b subunit
MSPRQTFFGSSIGSKFLIALSGLSLVAFLILHLIGNLMVFVSADAFNHYGDKLIHNPLLIPAELGLAALFLLHVGKAIALFMNARHARPAGYAVKRRAGHTSRKSWASMTMILSGAFLFVFVLLHLATFKYGQHYDSVSQPGVRDLYRLMVEVFSRPGWVVFYVVGMVIVGFHLWHGVSSAFQSLGVDHPRVTPKLLVAGKLLAVLIAAGFIVIAAWAYLAQSGRVRA